MNTNELRQKYLEFFRSKGHKVVPSDSLVPADDPTVLFTSAGMNQFKKEFLGQINDFRRAASCQKCLRTDDLDKVGKTASHHTFFEMLGNFSFGDYFKKEAITWAWEFVTEVLNVPEEKLWVSVYKDDEDTYKIWCDSIKIPSAKIIKLGDHDNFWPADTIIGGPNGPCGPCSEIFYDWGKGAGCGAPDCSPHCSCGRFVEVWNLVFTQFNRKGETGKKGILEPLPNKNIDTGMGLERMSSVMQEVKTNFEIDIFKPIVKEVVSVLGSANTELINAIADHIRAVVFAISDGVTPSNEERGYVVRKLIRRAFLHAKNLGSKNPFMYKIVPVICKVMKEPYPELEARRENIALIIKAEEEKFKGTLQEAEKIIGQSKELTAEEAFMLYDTHGYPLELLKEKGIKFNEAQVNLMLERQRALSKKSSLLAGDVFGVAMPQLNFKTEFLGYEKESSQAEVLAVIEDSDGKKIILDKTPFYAESGGQVGDSGILESEGASSEVYDTKKNNEAILHYVRIIKGEFKPKAKVTATVDKERRLDIARNHTATHLLQAALRKVLGEHVRQQGSFVSDEYLRFDFAHFKAATKDELLRVEELVNDYVRNNDRVIKDELSWEEAKKSGALAFFAEKYSDKVRIVSIADYSKEFCGGTHLETTGQISMFRITSEGSVASGIRRIEAITGSAAYKKIQEEAALITDLVELLKVPPEKLREEIDARMKYIKKLEKELVEQQLRLFEVNIAQFLKDVKEVKGIKVLAINAQLKDVGQMRKALDVLKNKLSGDFIAFVFSGYDGNYFYILTLSAGLKLKYDAKKIIDKLGLKGGGRADLAQGGMKVGDWQKGQEELFSTPERIQKTIGDIL
ncbi:MAG: alanine--tRNA ligase [Candidatus Omnitrophota bacterium]